ncbi:hypothetical protein M758_3G086600 [Ceratodon purpureus]|nr:hypothetical protein M758_3G086600 [Ceratodon purpureus]
MFGEEGTAAVPGTGLVPTRFVWPHGGRRVYLCGDFTRWQDTLPLSPVEGSSLVFQVICSLSPGYHQYKFIVDGEWRHDEQQAHMADSHGHVNNWLLITRQHHHIPPPTTDMASSGVTMDVDHEMVHQVGSGVDDLLQLHEGAQQDQQQLDRALMAESGATVVSSAEAEASRKNIQEFLKHHCAYELLPESGKVVALDVALPVKQAFHALYEQGIPGAPLWDSSSQQFVGMLTAADFISILQRLGSNGASVFSEEELEMHTIEEWKKEKQTLFPSAIHALAYVGPDDTLAHVASELMRLDVAQLPVLHYPAHALVPELLHLACLSGILRCICRHFRHVPSSVPLFSQPIGTLPIGNWVSGIAEPGSRPLQVLRRDEPLSRALALLLEGSVSACLCILCIQACLTVLIICKVQDTFYHEIKNFQCLLL